MYNVQYIYMYMYHIWASEYVAMVPQCPHGVQSCRKNIYPTATLSSPICCKIHLGVIARLSCLSTCLHSSQHCRLDTTLPYMFSVSHVQPTNISGSVMCSALHMLLVHGMYNYMYMYMYVYILTSSPVWYIQCTCTCIFGCLQPTELWFIDWIMCIYSGTSDNGPSQ